MILFGIDIGKPKHTFSIVDKETGEILMDPTDIKNNSEGLNFLLSKLKTYKKEEILIGIEDTGHYHFAILKKLLDSKYKVALINPIATDMTRKLQGGISKNDNLDSLTICDVIGSNSRKKPYRITTVDRFDLYEQRQLTRHHHTLKEELNVYCNRLQKCIDIVFPEFNSLFKGRYGNVYMDILKNYSSANEISNTDVRNLRKLFEVEGRGRRIELTAEQLKTAAKNSIGISSIAEEVQIKHLVNQIELIKTQLKEIDKKIEEFSRKLNSPILTIPGISHFSGTSILSELGNIDNFSCVAKIIKFAGVAPYEYESSQYRAEHMRITKKGSKYLRKTLFQIIRPVIQNNKVFQDYYNLKRSQGKGHLCAEGHCVRKLIRIIYHLCATNQAFDASLLK